jgi:hypothetical protein
MARARDERTRTVASLATIVCFGVMLIGPVLWTLGTAFFTLVLASVIAAPFLRCHPGS